MIVRRRSPYLTRACLFLSIAAATLGCSIDPVVETAATAAEPAAAETSVEPTRALEEPAEPTTIMLAIDTSLSMLAEDTVPNRFLGATEALDAFLDEVPEETYVGLVSFHGIVTVEVPPTTDRAAVRSAIRDLQLDEATAIGEAIFASIDALESFAIDFEGEPPPARIVVLSDGETTVGRPDSAAINQAQIAGITVSTIVFGTDAGTIEVPDMADQPQIPVPVNKTALAGIAEETGGEFFEAETTAALIEILSDIGSTSYCDALVALVKSPRTDGQLTDVEDYEKSLIRVVSLSPPVDRQAWELMLKLSEQPFTYENFNPATDALEAILPRLEDTCLRGLGEQVLVDDSGRVGRMSEILDE